MNKSMYNHLVFSGVFFILAFFVLYAIIFLLSLKIEPLIAVIDVLLFSFGVTLLILAGYPLDHRKNHSNRHF